jgi:hypothetical protein
MYNQRTKPIITDLQQRLYSILPEYAPISTHKGDDVGTYKAVDSDGNVFLVDFECGENGLRRQKRFFCDYAALMANSSLRTEPKRCDASENWVLTLLG